MLSYNSCCSNSLFSEMGSQNSRNSSSSQYSYLEHRAHDTPRYNNKHFGLHQAILTRDLTAVKRFLKTGLKPCKEDENENCFKLAFSLRDMKIFKYFIKKDPEGIHVRDGELETFLTLDIKYKESENFDYLLSKGIDPHAVNGFEETALILAAKSEAPWHVFKKLVLQHHVNVNARDSINNNALLYLLDCESYTEENIKKMKLLIDNGIDINAADYQKRTALMKASTLFEYGDLRVINLLLNHGAKIIVNENPEEKEKLTPMHFCASTLVKVPKMKVDETIENFFIPICNLFMEHERLIMFYHDEGFICPMEIIYESLELVNSLPLIKFILNKCIPYVREMEIICEEYHKPHHLMLFKLSYIYKSAQFTPLLRYLFSSPFKRYDAFCLTPVSWDYGFNFIGDFENMPRYLPHDLKSDLDTITSFIYHIKLEDLIDWLNFLKGYGFKISNCNIKGRSKSPLIVLLARFKIHPMKDSEEKLVAAIIAYLIKEGIDINEFLKADHFRDSVLSFLHSIFKLPTAIWISAFFGYKDILRVILPYWPHHPLSVMLYLRPWLELIPEKREEVTKAIINLYPILSEIGGTVAHGTGYYRLLYMHFDQLPLRMIQWIDLELYEQLVDVCNDFKQKHKNPGTLKNICRANLRITSGTINEKNILKHFNTFGLPIELNKYLSYFPILYPED